MWLTRGMQASHPVVSIELDLDVYVGAPWGVALEGGHIGSGLRGRALGGVLHRGRWGCVLGLRQGGRRRGCLGPWRRDNRP